MLVATACSAAVFVACSDDELEPIEELQFSRALSPIGLEAFIRTNTTIELKWVPREGIDTYVVEFATDSLLFSNIIFTDEVSPQDLPYRATFEGETLYSARVKAVGPGTAGDSKWSAIAIRTAAENIFFAIEEADLAAFEATLKWPAGSEVTHITLTPGNIQHTVTADEKAAGEATIQGLAAETSYTAKLMNNAKTRGTATFTTLIDLGGALAINPGDDLVAILDGAEDGASYVIFPGEYELGSYAVTKSVKLTGYLASDKPIIHGQFTCGAAVALLELKNLIFRGDEDPAAYIGQFLNTSSSSCNLTTLTIDNCEIRGYKDHLIYNNQTGAYGTITITNTIIDDIQGAGGDGIDFRGGSLGTLKVENTTFSNGFRTFLRMQVQSDVSFRNVTFYKVANFDNGNNHGLFRMSGGGSFEVRNSLFVETGVPGAVAPATLGNFCRQASNMVAGPVYSNNNIHGCHNLLTGLYTTVAAISATELDPGFANAAGGDFTVTNQDIIDNNIGDPRWLQ